MLRKLFLFILVSILTCIAALAQDVAPKPDDEKVDKVFSLASNGSNSYMGVEIKEITKDNFAEMGLSEVRGVGISNVLKDSPANKAGLLEGDILIRFNGEVLTSRKQLTRLISEVAPDHKANLTVLRNKTEVEIPITIGKRPVPQLFTGGIDLPNLAIPRDELPNIERALPRGNGQNGLVWRYSSGRSIGVGVTTLTKQLADYFGIKGGKGLLVDRVTKDSPADKAGLRAGDVIVEIDGKKISSTNDLVRSIYEKKEGDLNLLIIRDKNRQNVNVTLEPIEKGQNSVRTYDNSTH